MFDVFAVGVVGWFFYACLAFAVVGLRQAVENSEWRDLDDRLVVTAIAPVAAVGLAVFFGARALMFLAAKLRRIAVPFGCLVLMLTLVAPGQAFASDTALVIPWGAWLAGILDASVAPLAVLAIWGLRRLPAWVVESIERAFSARVEQLCSRAIDFAVKAVAARIRDRQVVIDPGSEIVRQAYDYAVRHAPVLSERIGLDLLKEKIFARVEPEDIAFAMGASEQTQAA